MNRDQRGSSRYGSDAFKAQQKATATDRANAIELLGLPKDKGVEKYIEMPPKRTDAFRGIPELDAIKGLKLVHFIKRDDVPPEVLHRARGVIIFDDQYILRKSIPYSESEVRDYIKRPNESNVFLKATKVSAKDSETIEVNPNKLRIDKYIEGTVVDVACANGQLHVFTSRNLVPRGVFDLDGTTIHKKAKIEGYHEAITDTFEDIVEKCDPRILQKDYMFGRDVMFSPYIYRFILVTRERVKASTEYIPTGGFLIYLGPIKQWEYHIDMEEEIYGAQHDPQPIRTVPTPPSIIGESYILARDENGLTIEEAEKVLRGNPVIKDMRFSGGGKLIITGRDVNGHQFLSHLESSSYAHRDSVLGQGTNLYDSFVISMSMSPYDLTNAGDVKKFWTRYGNFNIPDIQDIYERSNTGTMLTINFKKNMLAAPSEPIRIMWYNYLLCVNLSIRPQVSLFLKRYIADRTHLIKWLSEATPRTTFTGHNDDEANKLKEFILKTRTEILRSEAYHTGGYNQALLFISGEKAARLISISRKQTDTKKDSILISEPSATFYDELLPGTRTVKSDNIPVKPFYSWMVKK